MRYLVNVGPKDERFVTEAEARDFCQKEFASSGVILAIEKVGIGDRKFSLSQWNRFSDGRKAFESKIAKLNGQQVVIYSKR